jgi:ethanolamine utilization microcompartment shell protein EutL
MSIRCSKDELNCLSAPVIGAVRGADVDAVLPVGLKDAHGAAVYCSTSGAGRFQILLSGPARAPVRRAHRGSTVRQ